MKRMRIEKNKATGRSMASLLRPSVLSFYCGHFLVIKEVSLSTRTCVQKTVGAFQNDGSRPIRRHVSKQQKNI